VGTSDTQLLERTADSQDVDYEVIIMGAGISGVAQLYHLLQRGASVLVLEKNEGVGGTWYQNRYPGCRFDTESYTYSLSFSKDVLAEWHWKERFSPQEENRKYLEFVSDKFGLKEHMRFGVTIEKARWEEDKTRWRLSTSDGQELSCRIFISAVGGTGAVTLPLIEGRDTFQGLAFHAQHWPHRPLDLKGKRVGVIGTGATAVQIIPEIAPEVGELFVFQRHPNWCSPLQNGPISSEEMADIKERYEEIFEYCATTPGGMVHNVDRSGYYETSPEKRLEYWEQLYGTPGFSIWLDNYREIFTDPQANADISEFVANKIRGRVNDPVVAEKLIPTDHGFGMKRLPMESGYYEAFNRDNVHLVDVGDGGSPIERITPHGIKTGEQEYELDIIVYATGFWALTGPYERFDIRGRTGISFKEKWEDSVDTYLGLTHHGFPNLITIAGPQSNSAATNYPRGMEVQVEWANRLMDHLWANGYKRFEPTLEAEQAWSAHVEEMYSRILASRAERSWFTGYNANVPGHGVGSAPRYIVYNGGAPKYRRIIEDVADGGFAEFDFS
jgi:cation diffusion facilitator CzcD-associated flavoprotein CzcO